MLSSAYLSRKLTSPIPTKDGGTLRTIGEACEYMAAISKERELRPHWQRVRELMLQEADVAAVSHRARIAVLKDELARRASMEIAGTDSLQFSALGIHDQLSVGAAPAQSLHAPES